MHVKRFAEILSTALSGREENIAGPVSRRSEGTRPRSPSDMVPGAGATKALLPQPPCTLGNKGRTVPSPPPKSKFSLANAK